MNAKIVQRMSQYKSVLQKMKALGFVKVFSDNLGDALGVSASLVRRDFSSMGLAGNKRGGYQIDELITKLDYLLGKDHVRKVVIVGCGKIGTALMNYNGFRQEGIEVVAGFDMKPTHINRTAAIPILAADEMEAFIREHEIRIAVISVPEVAAGAVLDKMTACGVRGILNFAPVQLKSPNEDCIIQNLNIALEIEKLFSLVHFSEKEHQPESEA